MDGSAVGSGMIAEDTLLGVIDTLGGGVIVLDIDLKIVAANTLAPELLGVPSDLIASGSSWLDFVR